LNKNVYQERRKPGRQCFIFNNSNTNVGLDCLKNRLTDIFNVIDFDHYPRSITDVGLRTKLKKLVFKFHDQFWFFDNCNFRTSRRRTNYLMNCTHLLIGTWPSTNDLSSEEMWFFPWVGPHQLQRQKPSFPHQNNRLRWLKTPASTVLWKSVESRFVESLLYRKIVPLNDLKWPHKPNLRSVEFTIRRIHDSPNRFYTETGFKDREKFIAQDL